MDPIPVGKLFEKGFVPLILKEKKKESANCIAQSQEHKRMDLLQCNLYRNEGDSPENDGPESSPGQDDSPLRSLAFLPQMRCKFTCLLSDEESFPPDKDNLLSILPQKFCFF
jgi:hypothetical protein